MPTSNGNPETRKPDQQEVDFDIPTHVRRRREKGVEPLCREVRERLSLAEIRAIADADSKMRTPEGSGQKVDHESPKGPDALLDAYNFNEAGKACTMAMVINMSEGKITFVSPYTPKGPPDTKESLRGFFNGRFRFDQPNQFFLFYMGGKWNVINCKYDAVSIPDSELTKLWLKQREQEKIE